MIQEIDLKQVGVSEELIAKLTLFSINKAIEMMKDYGWCPEPDCRQPAEVDEDRNLGKCTECHYKFCT